MFGVGSEFALSKSWELQPEILLSQKGYKGGYSYGYYDPIQQKNTLNYVEIPLLIKYKFNIFYINIGPSVSYGIGGKYKLISKNSGEESSGNIKFGKGTLRGDVSYVDNPFDFSLVFGGGLTVLKNFNIDLRYELGQSNIYSGNKNYIPKFNRTFQITAGYLLKVSKKS